jgi:hypothetical protein
VFIRHIFGITTRTLLPTKQSVTYIAFSHWFELHDSTHTYIASSSTNKYVGYRGSSLTTQNSEYDRFPPATNGWGTLHPVSEVDPPLDVEEEEPPT